MNRGNDPRWQRLRRDKRSGFAAFLTVIAWVPVVVAIVMLSAPASQAAARGNPLYWLLLVPFAWWGASLTRYEAWAVRSIRPTQILAPVLGFGAIMIASYIGHDLLPFVVATLLSTTCSALAWFLYGGSLLEQKKAVL